jgi:predicted acylesterase/phospholipase RssA
MSRKRESIIAAAGLVFTLGYVAAGLSIGNAQSTAPTCPGDKRALVLSGGGIRGAYQLGSLWYLVHVLKCDFGHYVGTSTGALTAVVLAQAANHQELERRADLLARQYLNLGSQEQLVQSRLAAKARQLLPSWLGGLDGLYSLAPVERRLREQVDADKMRKDNLTVTAVSLQSGPLEDDFEPVSFIDYVLGSASLPLAIDPRQTRLWIRGVAVAIGDHTVVISTPFPPGLADADCQIWLNVQVVARCEQLSTELHRTVQVIASGNEYNIWHTTVRVFDVQAGSWEEFANRVRNQKDFNPSLLSLLQSAPRKYKRVEDVMTAWEPGPLIHFTTRHQLIDGGVIENLPVKSAIRRFPRIDTLVVLTAGDTLISDKTNVEARGGLDVASRAFEVLWDNYQQGSLEYIELMWSDLGRRNPLQPRLVLIEPWKRFFHETLEVNAGQIREALLHGCIVASALASAKVPRNDHFVRVRSYFNENDERACRPLQDMIAAGVSP